MRDAPYNVLFLCTGNSARSILAEAFLNRMVEQNFRAYSAGSQPKGEVHPMELKVLGDLNFPTANLRSKSWDEFVAADAPELPNSISSSPFAIMQRVKFARSGPASR